MSHERPKFGGDSSGGGNGGTKPKESTQRVDIPRVVADEIGRRVKEAARLALEIGECIGEAASKLEGHSTGRKRAILVALIREIGDARNANVSAMEAINAGEDMLRDVAEALTWELAQRK